MHHLRPSSDFLITAQMDCTSSMEKPCAATAPAMELLGRSERVAAGAEEPMRAAPRGPACSCKLSQGLAAAAVPPLRDARDAERTMLGTVGWARVGGRLGLWKDLAAAGNVAGALVRPTGTGMP